MICNLSTGMGIDSRSDRDNFGIHRGMSGTTLDLIEKESLYPDMGFHLCLWRSRCLVRYVFVLCWLKIRKTKAMMPAVAPVTKNSLEGAPLQAILHTREINLKRSRDIKHNLIAYGLRMHFIIELLTLQKNMLCIIIMKLFQCLNPIR